MPVTVTAQDPASRTPVADEVLSTAALLLGPTNTPIAVLAERCRVRVHDPANGIGWDIIETTASVPTAF